MITQLIVIQGVRVLKFPNREGLHNYQASSGEAESDKTVSDPENSGVHLISERPSFSFLGLSSKTGDSCVVQLDPQQNPIEAERPALTVLRLSGYVCMY